MNKKIIFKSYFNFLADIKLYNATHALEYHEYINNKGKPFNLITKIIGRNIYIYLILKNFFLLNILKLNTSKNIFFLKKKISHPIFLPHHAFGFQRSGTGSLRELIKFKYFSKLPAHGTNTHSPEVAKFASSNKKNKCILMLRNPVDCIMSLIVQREIISDYKESPSWLESWIRIELIRWYNFWKIKNHFFLWLPFIYLKNNGPLEISRIIFEKNIDNHLKEVPKNYSWEDIYLFNNSTKLKKKGHDANLPFADRYKNFVYIKEKIKSFISNEIDLHTIDDKIKFQCEKIKLI